jgi:hypothetical protein
MTIERKKVSAIGEFSLSHEQSGNAANRSAIAQTSLMEYFGGIFL